MGVDKRHYGIHVRVLITDILDICDIKEGLLDSTHNWSLVRGANIEKGT